ncbi:MAG TPA: hypothetical protein ENJ32_00965 [Crenotrichaceae bacterium]|nr:hypothetical protein [Crenotrichaceae bacterium]
MTDTQSRHFSPVNNNDLNSSNAGNKPIETKEQEELPMYKRRWITNQTAPYCILAIIAGFIIWWFRVYFTSEAVASVDLPSQISLTKQLKEQLLAGHLSFYDPTTFTGWPAFQFYGFFPSLVAACGAYLFSFFASDPVILSTHVLLVFGAALLPFSFYFAGLPLAQDLIGYDNDLPLHYRWTLALMSSVWCFWFLNHDQQWYGIGAAAPMTIGLFSQLFGWHFFLLHLGILLRYLRTGLTRYSILLSMSYGLLLISHTLTFVFSSFIVLLCWFWFSQYRWKLFTIHLTGIGLVAFWFVPFISLMGDFTTYSIVRPKGDFLELFFRYPLYGLLRSIHTWFSGEFKLINPINLINALLFITLFYHQKISKTGLLWMLFIFILLALTLFSSGFVATSFPIGLHYYRFLGYCFILAVLIACVIPLVYLRKEDNLTTAIITAIAIICFAATIALPHEKRKLIQANSTNTHLAVQNQVLDYFKDIPEKGRVYVEFLKSHKRFTPLARHYLSSQLYEFSGFESVVSSHLQETISYRMIVASVQMLGAKTYNSALLFKKNAQLDDRANIELLKSFGITHLVAGRSRFYRRIKRFAVLEPVKIGNYYIIQIQQPPTDKITPVNKQVIGFLDLKGNLPFHLIEFYFYSRRQLSKNFELIRLENRNAIPAGLDGLLINHDEDKLQLSEKWKTDNQYVIEINFSKHYLLDHYKPHYPHNVEIDAYHDVEDYLDKEAGLLKVFKQFGEFADAGLSSNENPELIWSDDKQTIYLNNLKPEQIYRINYSYFPYWQSQNGKVLRGSGERMFFIPNQPSATLKYSKWGFISTAIGYLLTLISWIIIGYKAKVKFRKYLSLLCIFQILNLH